MNVLVRYNPETGSGWEGSGDCWTEMAKCKDGEWVHIDDITALLVEVLAYMDGTEANDLIGRIKATIAASGRDSDGTE